MALLDDIQSIAGDVFGELLREATLYLPVRQTNRAGDVSMIEGAGIACRAIEVKGTEEMRAEEGYSQRDIRILVLQATAEGVAPHQLTADALIDFQGVRWRITGPIERDPADATWTFRATPHDG